MLYLQTSIDGTLQESNLS